MHISYNLERNTGYIRFLKECEEIVETLKVTKDANFDFARNGKLYGIELLNANEQLDGNGGVLQFLNANTNQLKEFRL